MLRRESNLELLRIISMIMIVIGHYSYWGVGNLSQLSEANRLFLIFIQLGGRIGVNIFALISFYFLVEQKFRIEKILNLVVKVKLFSLLFLFYGILFLNETNIKLIIMSIFPILFRLYWFITAYTLIFIFFPFFNLILEKLKKQEIKRILLVLLGVYCVLQTFIGSRLYYNEVIWFVVLYILSFYFRNYFDFSKLKSKKLILIIILLYIFEFISIGLGGKYFKRIPALGAEYSMTSFIISCLMFIFMFNLKIRYSKVINYIASKVLIVYLVHENVFFREVLWEKILHVQIIAKKEFFVLLIHSIVSVLFIFFLSIVLDEIVNFLFGNILKKIVNFIKNLLERKLKKVEVFALEITEKFEK